MAIVSRQVVGLQEPPRKTLQVGAGAGAAGGGVDLAGLEASTALPDICRQAGRQVHTKPLCTDMSATGCLAASQHLKHDAYGNTMHKV